MAHAYLTFCYITAVLAAAGAVANQIVKHCERVEHKKQRAKERKRIARNREIEREINAIRQS